MAADWSVRLQSLTGLQDRRQQMGKAAIPPRPAAPRKPPRAIFLPWRAMVIAERFFGIVDVSWPAGALRRARNAVCALIPLSVRFVKPAARY